MFPVEGSEIYECANVGSNENVSRVTKTKTETLRKGNQSHICDEMDAFQFCFNGRYHENTMEIKFLRYCFNSKYHGVNG